MQINKCDICRKEIKHHKSIDIRIGYDHYELCDGCGAPILKFLQKSKLTDKSKK